MLDGDMTATMRGGVESIEMKRTSIGLNLQATETRLVEGEELTPEELMEEYRHKVEEMLTSYPEGADPRAIRRFEEMPPLAVETIMQMQPEWVLELDWDSTKFMKWNSTLVKAYYGGHQ